MHVAATVVQLPDRFAARIVTDFAGRHDERMVESEACADLGDATALVVAVALDPDFENPQAPESPRAVGPGPLIPEPGPPEPSSHREVTRAPTPVVVEREPDPSSASPTVRSRVPQSSPADAVLLRVAPLVEYGSLPSVDAGLVLTAGLLWPRWRGEVFGLYLFPQRQTFGQTQGALQLGAVGARACHRLFIGRVEFPICLGLEGGALRAQTREQRPVTTLNLGWLAPSARAGLAVGGEHIGFFAAGEVAVSALVPQILVGEDSVFRTRSVSLRALAGVELLFSIDRR